jgi:hypothetical protein
MFYEDQKPPHVEFPLDLDLLPLVLAGIEAAQPGDAPLEIWRPHLDDLVGPTSALRPRPKLRAAPWPPVVRRVLEATDEPKRLRDVLVAVSQGGAATASDALRALEVLLAGGLVALQ